VDSTFSDHSFGFVLAVRRTKPLSALRHTSKGIWMGGRLGLEKFFDRVNHDKLISLVRERVKDDRVRALILPLSQGGCDDW